MDLGDVQVREQYHSQNYGSEPFVNYCSAPSSQRQGIYKFGLAYLYGLVDDADDILSAELLLYAYNETLDDDECVNMFAHHVYSYPFYQVNGSEWEEMLVTWDTKPVSSAINPAPEDMILFCNRMPSEVWLPFNVTGMVKQEFLQGDKNVSIYIATDEFIGHSSGDYVKTRSKESIHEDQRPYLLITYEGGGGDVAVTDFSAVYPQNPVVGDDILFRFRLSNLGTTGLEGIYYQVNTRGEPPFFSNTEPISLAVGDFVDVYELWSYGSAGSFMPEVIVDYEDLNVTNNMRRLPVLIGTAVPPPPLHGGGKYHSVMDGGESI
ncbi:MAG: DNRLRE domain-containing protein [Nanoarchaeota archaeon]